MKFTEKRAEKVRKAKKGIIVGRYKISWNPIDNTYTGIALSDIDEDGYAIWYEWKDGSKHPNYKDIKIGNNI